jgi:pyruvate,water dikinase
VPHRKQKQIAARLDQVRFFLWWREELRDISTQVYYFVRKYVLCLSRFFLEDGIIGEPSDIFFLPISDILEIVEGRFDRDEVARRIARNRIYYDSFRNFRNPDEIGSSFSPHHKGPDRRKKKRDKTLLIGIPCSSGKTIGRIKIIRDIFDAGRLEKRDILITRFTDPGWTPYFSLLSGVATETGGLLSHAAVISREYGIPAVLAVPNLLERLEEGMTVELDGGTGELRILKKERPQ